MLHDHSKWLFLLEAARGGDRDALGKLFQTYWDPLWKQAVLQIDESLQGKAAASDLVQETFFEAQRSFKDFRGSTPIELQSWLKSILMNNVRDVWRHYSGTKKRQASLEMPVYSVETNLNKIGTNFGSPSAEFRKQESIDLVHRVLSELPNHYATVIRLRHWESLTFETIALRMEKSPDAVRQLWYRALELFMERMIDHEIR